MGRDKICKARSLTVGSQSMPTSVPMSGIGIPKLDRMDSTGVNGPTYDGVD